MPAAISNTSPLILLHRIQIIDWLQQLFETVWTTPSVVDELNEGGVYGYTVPDLTKYDWLEIIEPNSTPPEWFALDLGLGELTAMALALENPGHILLLDDALARRTARLAGLNVWGTLRFLIEAKTGGLTTSIRPLVDQLQDAGLWMSEEIKRRVLRLAGE
jgi:predicted nucleic acid-binding protein